MEHVSSVTQRARVRAVLVDYHIVLVLLFIGGRITNREAFLFALLVFVHTGVRCDCVPFPDVVVWESNIHVL